MARRRVRNTPPPLPYCEADQAINDMERAVIYRSVSVDFTPDDLLDTLLPAEVRRKLRDAEPHTRSSVALWDVGLRLHEFTLNLQINCADLGTLTPHDAEPEAWGGFPEQTIKTPLITSTLLEISGIVRDFNVVRRVVKWLNDEKVTAGCARHYIPGLGSLLPPQHAFHQVSGERFKDYYFSPEIADAIRHTPNTIAKGLLSDPNNHSQRTGRQRVVFTSLDWDDHQKINLIVA